MGDFIKLWKETDEFIHSHEKEIADKYVHFLREVAMHYISKGIRVFFKENMVVHYGEGGFGWLLIECDDDGYEIFGDYITGISFEKVISERDAMNHVEIKAENLEDIRYEI